MKKTGLFILQFYRFKGTVSTLAQAVSCHAVWQIVAHISEQGTSSEARAEKDT